MRDAGSLLVRAGLIDADALAQARADRARGGGTLAEHLVLSGVIEDDELTQFFRERLMVPRVSSERLRSVPKRIIARIPAELAGELRVVPVALDAESSLTIAMSDPSDTHALDELEFFTEHYVVRAVASQRQIAWCLDNYYGVATPLLADRGTDLEGERTEPFHVRRPKRVSEAVRLERRRVVPPPTPGTAPPPKGRPQRLTPLEATLADLEASEELIEVAEVADPTDVDLVPELDSGAYELVLEDDEVSAEHPHIELDADEPVFVLEGDTLEDGSPGELAPRAGEVLVNLPSDLGEHGPGTGPAVVLDDSLFMTPSASRKVDAIHLDVRVEDDEETGQRHVEVDVDDEEATGQVVSPGAHSSAYDDDEQTGEHDIGPPGDDDKTGQVIRLEADEPPQDSGIVRDVIERGTDSAPILLSEVKAAAERLEREKRASAGVLPGPPEPDDKISQQGELSIEPLDDEPLDEASVVLLEMPKRQRRSTSLGVGVPISRAAEALGLRTGDADALAARAHAHLASSQSATPERRRESSEAPVIVDDQDISRELPELDDIAAARLAIARANKVEGRPSSKDDADAIDQGWESDTTLPEGRDLSGIEAAAVSELNASFASEATDGGDRDQLLETLESLAHADHRDQIVAAVLDYLDEYCDRVVFLALKSGALEPFQIRSSEPIKTPTSARLPLREVSLLRDIVDTRLPYRGPLEDEPSKKLLTAVFGDVSADGLAVPVAVRGRVVGLLYGDGISPTLSGDNVGLISQAAGRALERILKR